MSRSDVLVDADWVEARIGAPGTVIVEVDEDTSAYDKGHIPSAIKIDWKKDLQDPVRRDFVDKVGFETLLSERGISNDDTVVLYGGNNNWFAAYAYWYFKLYGHQNVLLLDGGRKKWELDSRELTRDVPSRAKTSYTASEQDATLRAMRDEVIDAIGKRNLVDVRSPDEFSGRLLAPAHLPQEQSQRGGHIPTAKNVPWSKAANEDGTFKADDELTTLYKDEAGVDFGKDTIAYCRIGERSAHTWFVLHEILGPAEREELRRIMDRVRLAGGRADRDRGGQVSNDSCGAPAGGVTITKDKAGKEAIVEGHVLRGGDPVATGYARLLGTGDEFVAEVPLGDDGGFRFFAAPGDWTLRVLAPGGVRLEQAVSADIGHVTTVEFAV